jgi:hypothetical protein
MYHQQITPIIGGGKYLQHYQNQKMDNYSRRMPSGASTFHMPGASSFYG